MKLLTKRRKNWLLIVASVIGVYVIISLDLSRPDKPSAIADNERQPHWILRDAVIDNFDASGSLVSQIHTSQAQYYLARDTVNLHTPIINYYQNHVLYWQALAGSGHAQPSLSTVTLQQDVVLQNTQEQQTINTQWLHADFNKSLLKTDKAVTIASPYTLTRAVGMIGNWDKKTLALLNNVHVHITPKP